MLNKVISVAFVVTLCARVVRAGQSCSVPADVAAIFVWFAVIARTIVLICDCIQAVHGEPDFCAYECEHAVFW